MISVRLAKELIASLRGPCPALTGEDENEERDDRSPVFDLTGINIFCHVDNSFVAMVDRERNTGSA